MRTGPKKKNRSPEMGPIGEALWQLTENMSWCFLLFSNSTVENCVSQGILSPRNKPQASSVATVNTDCHWALLPVWFLSLWACWGFSALACSGTGYRCRRPIQLCQCWAVENAHNIYIYIYICLRNLRQIKTWCSRGTNYKALSEL